MTLQEQLPPPANLVTFSRADIMTYDHPYRERSGRIFELKTMRVDSRMNKYNPRNPNRRALEKRVEEIEAHYTKRSKKLDATFAAGNKTNPIYGMNGIDSLVLCHFGEVNKGFKQINLFPCEGGCRITSTRETELLRALRITSREGGAGHGLLKSDNWFETLHVKQN